LAPYFVSDYADENGLLHAATLEPRLEQNLAARVQRSHFEIGLSVDPQTAHQALSEMNRLLGEMVGANLNPVILTVAELRLPFKRFFESSLPRMTVLSYQEIPSNVEIRHFGVITAPSPNSRQSVDPAAAQAAKADLVMS